jgi:hypothetical protein
VHFQDNVDLSAVSKILGFFTCHGIASEQMLVGYVTRASPIPLISFPSVIVLKFCKNGPIFPSMCSMEWSLGSENPKKIPEQSVGAGRFCASAPVSGKDLIAYKNEVLRKYDRQTMRVTSGLLICTILAAVVVALQVPGKNAADHAIKENLVSDDAAVNSSPTTLSGVRTGNTESTNSEITSGQTISIDRTDTLISRGQNSSPLTVSPESSQTPVSALTSETYQPETQASASPMQRQDIVRVIRQNIRNLRHRLHGRVKLDVKSRLIALWHESLRRSQHPRVWVAPWYLK